MARKGMDLNLIVVILKNNNSGEKKGYLSNEKT